MRLVITFVPAPKYFLLCSRLTFMMVQDYHCCGLKKVLIRQRYILYLNHTNVFGYFKTMYPYIFPFAVYFNVRARMYVNNKI